MLLATGNPHKVGEIEAILREALPDVRFAIESAADRGGIAEPEESGATFEENASLKARHYAAATGRLALADDSGLVVDALDGRPGVLSARYAPTSPERIERLLRELAEVPESQRAARFVCVAALAAPDGRVVTREGRLEGRIAPAPAGRGGFGYDPIFIPNEQASGPTRTLAEFTAEEKNRISHRGRAIRALAPAIARALRAGDLSNET